LASYREEDLIAKLEHDYRQLMEQAIKVMRNLINEPRIDGKASSFASYFLIESV